MRSSQGGFLIFFILIWLGCTDEPNEKHLVKLVPVPFDKELVWETDSSANIFPRALNVYFDSLLVVMDRNLNGLRFYKIPGGDSLLTIHFPPEGRNSLGTELDGFYAITPDSFIGKTKNLDELFYFNRFGIISEKHKIIDDKENYYYFPTLRSSIHFYDDHVYLANSESERGVRLSELHNKPAIAKVDLNNYSAKVILKHPSEYKVPLRGSNKAFFTGYNDRLYISFSLSHDLYIYDLAKDSLFKIPAKSPYVAEKFRGMNPEDRWTDYLRKYGSYWDVEYDPWRKLIYRIVIHKIGEDDPQLYQTVADFPFSVLVFNENYEMIGETVFEPNQYYLHFNFAGPGGLYISKLDDNDFEYRYSCLRPEFINQQE